MLNKPSTAGPPAPSSASPPYATSVWVDHPLIRRDVLEDRTYQRAIAATCLRRSTLVVLPTGLGKTAIAVRVLAEVLRERGGKILILAPTKPLVEQHAGYVRATTVLEDVVALTGESPPEDRELAWRASKVVVSTPQVIENDLRNGRFDLSAVTLLVVDEAHRAVGDYAYVEVSRAYEGLVLGMTASPGNLREQIREVCDNLKIDLGAVEVRTPLDPDVVEYVHDVSMERVYVDVPQDTRPVIAQLRSLFDRTVDDLKRRGYLTAPRPNVRDLLALGDEARRRLDSGEKDPSLYQVISKQAIAMKLNHAIELAETQGLQALQVYADRLERDKGTRANRTLLKDPVFQAALAATRGSTTEHPKVRKAVEVVLGHLRQNPGSRAIVFAHYRDMVDLLVQALTAAPGLRPARFVGQAGREEKEGMSQKEQSELLQRFRDGECNVLVSTSIGEEGLDVPATDLVVFYEPVPSEIRTIQRRGRTGRARAGRLVLLLTKDTRDESYYYSARRKESRMHEELDRFRRELGQMRLTAGRPSPPAPPPVPAAPEPVRQVTKPRREGQASLSEYDG